MKLPVGLVVLAVFGIQIPLLVLVILAVIAGLIVLYLLARWIKPFGQSLGFVCAVAGRLLVTLSYHMDNAAAYCKRACLASLAYPSGVSDGEYWSGVNVLSRLVYFVLAVLILAGETLNTLLVLPSLFNTTSNIHLPDIVELASASLFICCPALCGAVILECVGLIPHGAGLFPKMNKGALWVLGLLSGVVLVLAILVTGYFYIFRAVYLLDPQSTQGMSIYILGGLGLETAAVAVIALWALVVGGAGVVSLFMWMAEKTSEAIAASASFLPELLDILALHLTDGMIGVYGKQIERDPHKYPAFHAAPSRSLQSGPAGSSLRTSPVVVDASGSSIVPMSTQEWESTMNPDKNAAIVLVGSYGTKMLRPVSQEIDIQRAVESFLSSLYLDLNITHVPTALPGIVDITPTYAERKAALLHSDTEGQAYHALLNHAADRLVETHMDTKASPSPLIFVIDCRHLVDCVDMLESIKRRLPLHSLVVVTSLSEADMQNKVVQTGLTDMQALHAEDVIETVFVTHRSAAIASTYGEETQSQFVAHALVSLVIAHKHILQNRSCTTVLADLHSLSPFTALSFASLPVAVGDVPKRWKFVPGVKDHAGTGNYGDILSQVRSAIERVITDEGTASFPAFVRSESACFVLSSVPLDLQDKRFAACVRDTALFVSAKFPFATSIVTRGNGIAYPHHMGSKFLVTASCLYPLQPQSFPRLHEGKSVKVTTLYPMPSALEPVSSNGHLPEDEQTNEVKQTKAVATAKQKKTSAVRKQKKAQ